MRCKNGFEVKPGDRFYIASGGEVMELTVDRLVCCFDRDPPQEFVLVGDILYHPHQVQKDKQEALQEHLDELQRQLNATDKLHMDLLDKKQRVLEALGHDVLNTNQATS